MGHSKPPLRSMPAACAQAALATPPQCKAQSARRRWRAVAPTSHGSGDGRVTAARAGRDQMHPDVAPPSRQRSPTPTSRRWQRQLFSSLCGRRLFGLECVRRICGFVFPRRTFERTRTLTRTTRRAHVVRRNECESCLWRPRSAYSYSADTTAAETAVWAGRREQRRIALRKRREVDADARLASMAGSKPAPRRMGAPCDQAPFAARPPAQRRIAGLSRRQSRHERRIALRERRDVDADTRLASMGHSKPPLRSVRLTCAHAPFVARLQPQRRNDAGGAREGTSGESLCGSDETSTPTRGSPP